MSETIAVYEGDKVIGFFDPRLGKELAEICESSQFEIQESGMAAWTALYQLPKDVYVLAERTWDEFAGPCDGKAYRISRAEAIQWLLHNGIRPPDDLLADAGLVDFTKDGQAGAPFTPEHKIDRPSYSRLKLANRTPHHGASGRHIRREQASASLKLSLQHQFNYPSPLIRP